MLPEIALSLMVGQFMDQGLTLKLVVQGQMSVGYRGHVYISIKHLKNKAIQFSMDEKKASKCIKLLDDHQRNGRGCHLVIQNEDKNIPGKLL